MKINVLQENVRAALMHVSKVVPTKPQLPILSSILLKADKQGLQLAATDLYLGVRATVLGEILEEGSLVIPGKTLLETISNMGAGKLTLETANSQLIITSSTSRIEINGQPAQEYPDFPAQSGQELTLTQDLLEKINTFVRFSAGIDQTRLVLTSLLFELDADQLKVVGTDGFRLAVLVEKQSLTSEKQSILIPNKAISEVCRIMAQEQVSSVKLFIASELKQAVFQVGTAEVFVLLIEGDYPPYQKIMPATFAIQATWDGEEFAAQLKRAQIFARESSNIVKLELTKSELIITSTSALQGKYVGKMAVNLIQGDRATIAFNLKYVQDYLINTKPTTIWFGMNESLKPALMRTQGMEEYSYIVMPFRVNEA